MHRGSLFKLLRKGGDVPLDGKLQRSIAVSVARGMAYLHTRDPPLLHLVRPCSTTPMCVCTRVRVCISCLGGGFPAFLSLPAKQRPPMPPLHASYTPIILLNKLNQLGRPSTCLQDLKSPNILIDDKWRIKIADFGLSRMQQNTYVSASAGGVGTPEWMAPEVLRSEQYNEKADVYSYGVVRLLILGSVRQGGMGGRRHIVYQE